MSRRTTQRCARVASEADVARLQADGVMDQGDAEPKIPQLGERCSECGPGYRIGDDGCHHGAAASNGRSTTP